MKRKKLFLYVILALLAIIVVAFIIVGNYTDRLIDPYVRSLLHETRPMGHKIEYGKIRVNLFKGSIIVTEVKISPDTSLGEGRARYEIEVDDIKLTDFSIRKMIFDQTLSIQDFRIDNPMFRITLPPETEDAINEIKERQAPKPKDEFLEQVALDRVVISGGDFKLYRDDKLLASSDHINFVATSISLVQDSVVGHLGYTYDDVNLNLSHIDLYSESGLYDIKLGFLEASRKDSSVTMKGFEMIPKYDKKVFSDSLEYQNDRFDMNIGRIDIAGVGLRRWLAGNPLIINRIHIDSLDADIYRDKNVPFNVNHFPQFYNELFLKINIPLYLDTVLITNSKILYGELVAEHPVAGSILLEDFNLQLYDLTNQVAEDPAESQMHFKIQAQVMGEGNMNIDLALPLEGDLHKFKCSGSVGAMQLSPLNDMLEPSMNMKFNGGRVDRMTFDFTANDNSSYGWMEFLYSDLDVALVKKNPDKQWAFVSLLANAMAVSNNSQKDQEAKIVEIGYERDKNKGIINYVWKTIQSGMVRTIIPTNKHEIKMDKDKKEQHREKEGEKKKKKD